MKKVVLWTETGILILTVILSCVIYAFQYFAEVSERDQLVISVKYRMFPSVEEVEKEQHDEFEWPASFYLYNDWWFPYSRNVQLARGCAYRVYDMEENLVADGIQPTNRGGGQNQEEYFKWEDVLYENFLELDEAEKNDVIASHFPSHWYGTTGYILSENGAEKYVLVFLLYENTFYVAFLRTVKYIIALFVSFELIALVAFWLYWNYLKKRRQLEAERQAFLHGISHELKTPAAIIKNSAECLREDINEEHKSEYLDLIDGEVDHMDELLQAMLVFSETSNSQKLVPEPIALKETLENALQKYEPLIAKKNVRVEKAELQDVAVSADPRLIPYVFDNLISNAVKYCEEDGTIRVSATPEDKATVLSIYNSGSYIPEDALPHIWEPLYVVDKSRSEQDGSSGMGLAICANILNLHGATYSCRNVDAGVEFVVRFPNS